MRKNGEAMTREKQKEQALKNIKTLMRTFRLSSDIMEACKEDDILYSLALKYQNRRWAINCTLAGHKEFSEIVREFEAKYEAYVYHCLVNGDLFTMLYVGKNEEDWNLLSPSPDGDVVYAAVYNTTYHFIEFGYVQLDRLSKTLIRIA